MFKRLLSHVSAAALGLAPVLAQNVYPPVIPPGANLLPLNNTWTGTNTFVGLVTGSNFPIFAEQYGAVGDGVTDDSTAINNACAAAASAHRELHLLGKNYAIVAAMMNCPTPPPLISGVYGATNIVYTGAVANKTLITLGNLSSRSYNFTIKDIACTRSIADAGSTCLRIQNSADWVVDNVSASCGANCLGYGITLYADGQSWIKNSYFSNLANTAFNLTGDAPQALNTSDIHIVDSSCYGSGQYCINVGTYAWGTYFDRNVLYGAGSVGIAFGVTSPIFVQYSPPTITNGGAGYSVGCIVTLQTATAGLTQVAPVQMQVATVTGSAIATMNTYDFGGFTDSTFPSPGSINLTYTQASASGCSGTGATFSGTVSNNSSVAKIQDNDIDSDNTGIYVQGFGSVIASGNWISSNNNGIFLLNTASINIVGGINFPTSSGSGVVIGDGTAGNAPTGVDISGVTFSGGNKHVYIRGYSSNVSISGGSMKYSAYTGVSATDGNNSALRIDKDSILFNGNAYNILVTGPTIASGFGAGATIDANCNDNDCTIIEGAASTGGTLTWGIGRGLTGGVGTIPHCVCGGSVPTLACTASASGLTVSHVSGATNINVLCRPQ